MQGGAMTEREASPIAPIDVAVPEIFAEDCWQEPFRTLRAKAPIQFVPDSKFGPYWSVASLRAARAKSRALTR